MTLREIAERIGVTNIGSLRQRLAKLAEDGKVDSMIVNVDGKRQRVYRDEEKQPKTKRRAIPVGSLTGGSRVTFARR